MNGNNGNSIYSKGIRYENTEAEKRKGKSTKEKNFIWNMETEKKRRFKPLDSIV